MDKASPVSYQKLTREPSDLYQLLSDDIHDSVSSVCPCLIFGLVPTNGKWIFFICEIWQKIEEKQSEKPNMCILIQYVESHGELFWNILKIVWLLLKHVSSFCGYEKYFRNYAFRVTFFPKPHIYFF